MIVIVIVVVHTGDWRMYSVSFSFSLVFMILDNRVEKFSKLKSYFIFIRAKSFFVH